MNNELKKLKMLKVDLEAGRNFFNSVGTFTAAYMVYTKQDQSWWLAGGSILLAVGLSSIVMIWLIGKLNVKIESFKDDPP